MASALSAYNSVDVIREAQGTVTDAVIVVFNAAMVDVLSEDQKRCVLKESGEFARWGQARTERPERLPDRAPSQKNRRYGQG